MDGLTSKVMSTEEGKGREGKYFDSSPYTIVVNELVDEQQQSK